MWPASSRVSVEAREGEVSTWHSCPFQPGLYECRSSGELDFPALPSENKVFSSLCSWKLSEEMGFHSHQAVASNKAAQTLLLLGSAKRNQTFKYDPEVSEDQNVKVSIKKKNHSSHQEPGKT